MTGVNACREEAFTNRFRNSNREGELVTYVDKKLTEILQRNKKGEKMKKINVYLRILILISLGLLAILSSQIINNDFWKATFSNVGSAILVAGILTVLSEFFLKRDLVDYVIERIGLKMQIDHSGLQEIYTSASDINYVSLLREARLTVDIVHINGLEWIGRHIDEVKKILNRKDCTIQVFLMSPESIFLEALSQHFNQSKEDMIKKIESSVREWTKLAESDNPLKGRLKIYYHTEHPTASLIRVDNKIINIQNRLVSGKSKKLFCTIFQSTNHEDDMYSLQVREIKELERSSKLIYESKN